MFKLDQNPGGSGLRCDDGGLFLGRDALLKRDRNGKFEARTAAEVQGILGRAYRDETNWESRIRSVHLVADALNKGDVALAMITAVLMRLPDPTENIADTDRALVKAGFNPDEPRDERGRWTNDGSGSKNGDAENPPGNTHETMWEMLGDELSGSAKALLSRIGQAQIDEDDAELYAATSGANAIANWLGELAAYRAKPWIDPNGNTVQVSVISTGDPFSDRAALIEHELFHPNAPLTRPGTNADWIDPLITLTSAGALAAGLIFGAGALAGGVTDTLGAEAESVWTLTPIQRGIAIEQKLATTEYADWYYVGQENNGYFPLVDFQQGDTLVSLRTVDTTGVTWYNRTWAHIVDLGDSEATVDEKLANMELDLRVQPGGLDDAQPLVKLGLKKGVTVRIKEFP